MILWYYFDMPKNLVLDNLCTEIEPPQNLQSLLGLGLKSRSALQFPYNDSTKTPKRFKREF